MKSCFEGHKRRRIYRPHKSPIICVILFPLSLVFCSPTPAGAPEKYGVPLGWGGGRGLVVVGGGAGGPLRPCWGDLREYQPFNQCAQLLPIAHNNEV